MKLVIEQLAQHINYIIRHYLSFALRKLNFKEKGFAEVSKKIYCSKNLLQYECVKDSIIKSYWEIIIMHQIQGCKYEY